MKLPRGNCRFSSRRIIEICIFTPASEATRGRADRAGQATPAGEIATWQFRSGTQEIRKGLNHG